MVRPLFAVAVAVRLLEVSPSQRQQLLWPLALHFDMSGQCWRPLEPLLVVQASDSSLLLACFVGLREEQLELRDPLVLLE
jgi:hypothetical protein